MVSINTITFINEKGGVGKSSVCFNTAWELAMTGSRVLIIDLDGQKANITEFAGISKVVRLPDGDEEDIESVYDVLRGRRGIADIKVTVRENLDVLPATVDATKISPTEKISTLRKAMAEISGDYDYIFFDVNPSPNWSHILALSVSQYAIIPMLPEITSLDGNKGIMETIVEARESTNPNLKILGFLFNRYTGRTNLSKQVYSVTEKLAKKMDTKIFNSTIRNSVALGENVAFHMGITEYAPKSTAADDYRAFVAELKKEIEENG